MPIEPPYSLMTANLVHPVRVVHVDAQGRTDRADVAATEEPLEIRIDGEAFAVIMRTPGADRELTAGFLLAERVIQSARDISVLARDADVQNAINVTLREPAPPASAARRTFTSSSCGLCGRAAIESLRVTAPAIRADWKIAAGTVAALPDALRRAQAAFAETGGIHAAGLFDAAGSLELAAEDVGRHNAVDKVVGRMLLDDRLPLGERILFVSGRTSYEIVQKAFVAGIPIVAAVSAPSSLAVELADETGITLIGFVRRASFNVYSHAYRLVD